MLIAIIANGNATPQFFINTCTMIMLAVAASCYIDWGKSRTYVQFCIVNVLENAKLHTCA